MIGNLSLGSGITETQDLAKLLIDKNDQKWVQLKNNGLIVFDERNKGLKHVSSQIAKIQATLLQTEFFHLPKT